MSCFNSTAANLAAGFDITGTGQVTISATSGRKTSLQQLAFTDVVAYRAMYHCYFVSWWPAVAATIAKEATTEAVGLLGRAPDATGNSAQRSRLMGFRAGVALLPDAGTARSASASSTATAKAGSASSCC